MAAACKCFLLYLLLFSHFVNSVDIIAHNQSFREGNLLVSRGNSFAFGFFTSRSSGNKYVGIWFHGLSERSVVWVANRNNPVNGSSPVLSINQYGNLVLYNDADNQVVVWSTNITEKLTGTCVAQLLDSGNLVLMETVSEKILWESFDYPTDTMLPGMKFGRSQKLGLEWDLTSWRSADDPAIGDYLFKLDPTGSPQVILYKGSRIYWRTHLWPARKISGVYNYTYVNNQDELYSLFHMNDPSVIIRLMVDPLGFYKWMTWHENDGKWKEFWTAPTYPCDFYAKCGAYSRCTPSNPDIFECSCLPGYEPKSPRDWYLRDASQGCIKKRQESSSICGKGEGFLKINNVKFSDSSNAEWLGMNLSRMECEHECLSNCSCSAYAISEKDGRETGCIVWYGELIDTVDHIDRNLDMYIRVDAIELAQNTRKTYASSGKQQAALAVPICIAWLTIFFFIYLWFRRRKKGMKNKWRDKIFDPISGSIYYKNTLVASAIGGDNRPPDITFFDLSSIFSATNNFSPDNKLGQGGFGSVYKGRLFDGREVAVKRLSENSAQGTEEFKNEVMLIAKLQHRNLVKLMGCCLEGKEQMLVYEYLPNRSLDLFLFDSDQKRLLLDWRKRYNIINGVARGILYLHQDSRLRIIHRDLKSSNILLDAEMNPKISDFGLARIFRTDQFQDKTNRVVGTYGYMSPEYAVFGKFSIKSDVFSFGVISLEVITGKKNNGFQQTDASLSLIGHVWHLWNEGRVLEIVDSSFKESYSTQDALRSIQIALLCVQENADDRPTMLQVVLMLSTEAALPSPKQPPFVFATSCRNTSSLGAEDEGSSSVDEVTISRLFKAR